MELLIANRFGGVERVRVIGAVEEIKPPPQPTEAPATPEGVVVLFPLQYADVIAGSQFGFFQPRFSGTAKVAILPQATGVLSGSAQTIGGSLVNVTGALRNGVQFIANQWDTVILDITADTVYALSYSTACRLAVQITGTPRIVGAGADTVQLAGSNAADGSPVSQAISVVLDSNGRPILRMVDAAPFAYDSALNSFYQELIKTNFDAQVGTGIPQNVLATGVYDGQKMQALRATAKTVITDELALGATSRNGSLYTPSSGKSFRLLGFIFGSSAATAFRIEENDGTTYTTVANGYCPASGSVPYTFPNNGYLSIKAGNALGVYVASATSVSVTFVLGNDE